MDVSIIIVNYNTKDLTLNCIDSIYKYTSDVSFEIILVDNNSTDGSKELFSNDRRVVWVESNENLGFGKANNLGFKYAKGDYIFLLNSDTILLNNAIYILLDYLKNKASTVVGVGCFLEDKEGNIIQSEGEYLSISKTLYNKFCSLMSLGYSLKNQEKINRMDLPSEKQVEVIVGADLLLSRIVIEKYGFFNPRFFMYHEENDLQRRYATLSNKKFILLSTPRIIHLEGGSSSPSMKKRIMGERGMFTYLSLWNNKFKYLFFRILFFILRLPLVFNKKYSFDERKEYFLHLLS